MKDIPVPLSPGEMLDKITILRIKARAHERRHQGRQREARTRPAGDDLKDSGAAAVDLGPRRANLTRQRGLWVIEGDDIRDEERAGRFGEKFELARAVYTTNDERAAIKRINVVRLDHRRREIVQTLQGGLSMKRREMLTMAAAAAAAYGTGPPVCRGAHSRPLSP
jgi:hypothetical protein